MRDIERIRAMAKPSGFLNTVSKIVSGSLSHPSTSSVVIKTSEGVLEAGPSSDLSSVDLSWANLAGVDLGRAKRGDTPYSLASLFYY